jgi:hypothetical protein
MYVNSKMLKLFQEWGRVRKESRGECEFKYEIFDTL